MTANQINRLKRRVSKVRYGDPDLLTLRGFADLIGTTKTNVWRWIRQDQKPSPIFVRQLQSLKAEIDTEVAARPKTTVREAEAGRRKTRVAPGFLNTPW